MTDAADKITNLWKDSYLAYIPLLGAAVAVTFDVRYFFALNWSFFTLLSLSEHILFAIQAFPIAASNCSAQFNRTRNYTKCAVPAITSGTSQYSKATRY